jgi:hypothetical protein
VREIYDLEYIKLGILLHKRIMYAIMSVNMNQLVRYRIHEKQRDSYIMKITRKFVNHK